MEDVNCSRKRLEAAAGALMQGRAQGVSPGAPEPATRREATTECRLELIAAAEGFGQILRNEGSLVAAVTHLERAVEILRGMCSGEQTEAKVAAFEEAIRILVLEEEGLGQNTPLGTPV
jgi:hypothetical protein